jgi:predicted methyltransferase
MPTLASRRRAAIVLSALLSGLTLHAQSGAVAPAAIFEALNIKEGQTACEIGAGAGDLTLAVAKLVGPKGHVYTSELGDNRLLTLRERVAAGRSDEHAPITVVTGEATRTNFPEAGCDAVFLKDVYHHFTEPAAMNASIAAALKPGARLAIVDFTPPPGREASRPADRGVDGSHGVTPPTVVKEMKEAGLESLPRENGSDRWFLLVFEKRRSGAYPATNVTATVTSTSTGVPFSIVGVYCH